jgi:hypothetical protein
VFTHNCETLWSRWKETAFSVAKRKSIYIYDVKISGFTRSSIYIYIYVGYPESKFRLRILPLQRCGHDDALACRVV